MLTTIEASGELFHTAAGTAFTDLVIDGHRETWPIRSKRFRFGCADAITRRPGPPRARRRSARRSICSKRRHSSTVLSGRFTSESQSMAVASISIWLMSAGGRSKLAPTDGA